MLKMPWSDCVINKAMSQKFSYERKIVKVIKPMKLEYLWRFRRNWKFSFPQLVLNKKIGWKREVRRIKLAWIRHVNRRVIRRVDASSIWYSSCQRLTSGHERRLLVNNWVAALPAPSTRVIIIFTKLSRAHYRIQASLCRIYFVLIWATCIQLVLILNISSDHLVEGSSPISESIGTLF